MSNQQQWASLAGIKFVRPKDIRRQGASYLAENYYTGERGLLLAPNHFVLPKFEPIAWTQRALFFDEPSGNLVALNTKLGVPEVSEVVSVFS
jgi:sacsin